MKKFVLIDGYVTLNNEQLFIDVNNYKKDLKKRGGWLGVFLIFVGISVFNNLKNADYFKHIYQYIDFGLRILGGLAIIGTIYYLLFKHKSKSKLIINDIKTVELDKMEFDTEVTLVFSNKKEFDISFRNLENQLEPFLEELKKKNTRLEIKKN